MDRGLDSINVIRLVFLEVSIILCRWRNNKYEAALIGENSTRFISDYNILVASTN